MKIKQVDIEYVKEHLDIKGMANENIYRLLACDDGNYGKSHMTVKIKPLKNLKIEELLGADSEDCAFIEVEL